MRGGFIVYMPPLISLRIEYCLMINLKLPTNSKIMLEEYQTCYQREDLKSLLAAKKASSEDITTRKIERNQDLVNIFQMISCASKKEEEFHWYLHFVCYLISSRRVVSFCFVLWIFYI